MTPSDRDRLGPVRISQRLLDLAKDYVPPVSVAPTVSGVDTGEWVVVKTYTASNGKSIHTVSMNDKQEFKCTCQSFRIRKTGDCKHTIDAATQLSLNV